MMLRLDSCGKLKPDWPALSCSRYLRTSRAEMNGRELGEKESQMRTLLKVLYMTAYSRSAVVHHDRLIKALIFCKGRFPRKLASALRVARSSIPRFPWPP